MVVVVVGGARAMAETARLLVLYASQTGNAQDVAERIGREGKRGDFDAWVMSMDEYFVGDLPKERIVIFVASTTGQGEPPDSMKAFWKFLLRRGLGSDWLKAVRYAVFGLGDSGYLKYNIVAKKLDRRISDLGGNVIVEKGLGDDQHPLGYDAALDPWLSSLWRALRGSFLLVNSIDYVSEGNGNKILDPPRFHVVYHSLPAEIEQTRCSGEEDRWVEIQNARRMMEAADKPLKSCIADNAGYGPNQPYLARLICNKRLTEPDHEQDVRHIEFDIRSSGIQYAPGDVLAVMPSQDRQAVDAFMKRCCLNPDAYVTVETTKSQYLDRRMDKECRVKIQTIVEYVLDVASATPRRYFFEVMSYFATAEHEREKLQYFATPEGHNDLYEYNQRERRNVLEILEDFPSVQLPLEWLLQLVPRLQPRYFSISSSMLVHPHEVHITVAVVSWVTAFKRIRHGLCSTWLSQIDPKDEAAVPIWKREGTLKFPPPSVPLILVGPGTGCAPFRAFIQERASLSSSQPIASILFFFGCRKERKDFLYRDCWLSEAANGILSEQTGGGFLVAFSRDQQNKVYVQDKIKQASKKVWGLLQSGGAIYIAGSANKMPIDVATALEEVVVQESGLSKDTAQRLLKQLERVGRYHVEVWS